MMSREQNGILVNPPTMTFSDIAGREKLVSLLKALAYDDELDGDIGLKKARAVVLCGEKGCGKSSLAAALTGELALQGYSCAEVDAADFPQDMKKQLAEILSKSSCVLNIKNVEKLCDTGELDRILDEAESAANPLLMLAAAEYETARSLRALRSFNFIYVDMPKKSDIDAYLKKVLWDESFDCIRKLSDSVNGHGYAEIATLVNYWRLLSKCAYYQGELSNADRIVTRTTTYGTPPKTNSSPAMNTFIQYSQQSGSQEQRTATPIANTRKNNTATNDPDLDEFVILDEFGYSDLFNI